MRSINAILLVLMFVVLMSSSVFAKPMPTPDTRDNSMEWKMELARRMFRLAQKGGTTMQPEQLKRAIVIEMTVLILKQDEDYRATPYRDSKGYWTYGYGERSDTPPKYISEPDAEKLLRKRVLEFVASLDRNTPWWTTLDVVRQSALLNMHFNMGNRLWAFEQMLTALKNKQYHKAALEVIYEKGKPSGYWKDVKHRALRIAHAIHHGTLEFAENVVDVESVALGYTDITYVTTNA